MQTNLNKAFRFSWKKNILEWSRVADILMLLHQTTPRQLAQLKMGPLWYIIKGQIHITG